MSDGISRLTALIIQHGVVGEDLDLDVTTDDTTGKYGWLISLPRDHCRPLLEAQSYYDTPEEARQSMEKIVQMIKESDAL